MKKQLDSSMKTGVIRALLLTFALVLAARQGAAQTTGPVDVMYHWGPMHKAPGQAIVLSVEVTDHFGDPTLTVPAELLLEDKDGNVVYRNSVTLSAGHTFTAVFVVGPEYRAALSTIQGDIYAVIGPQFRLLQPCVKVSPPGPSSPSDQIFATLEMVDVLTGRVQVFSNTPTIRAGVGVPG